MERSRAIVENDLTFRGLQTALSNAASPRYTEYRSSEKPPGRDEIADEEHRWQQHPSGTLDPYPARLSSVPVVHMDGHQFYDRK